MNTSPAEIDPRKLYSMAEAASLLPSVRPGKRVHLNSLRRWRRDGLLRCERIAHNWFVTGQELLRFMHLDKMEWNGRTPKERQKEIDAAERELRQRGVL